MSGVLVPPSPQLMLPDFVRPITPLEARWQRWRHNFVSWLSIPCVALGRCAPANSFGILMYHRVCPLPKERFPPTYNVTPATLKRQLSWLVGNGYRPQSLVKLLGMRDSGQPIPPRSFAVTFDDGYANNLTQALPVLRELQIPATIFLATAYIGSEQPFPFDNWIAGSKRLAGMEECWRPLNLDECGQLLDSRLIELGCHTHTHADFRGKPELLGNDLVESLDFLRQYLGVERPAFSYPFGVPQLGFASPELADVVRRAGCRCAVQIGNSLVETDSDPYHFARFDVASASTGLSLAGKLDGWSQGLRSVWRTIRRRTQHASH